MRTDKLITQLTEYDIQQLAIRKDIQHKISQVIWSVMDIGRTLDDCILRTPTSTYRDMLTDANIHLLAMHDKLRNLPK